MINFINAENCGGMLTGIFDWEDLENENFNMYDTILSKDCWILWIANDDCDAVVFNARQQEIYFIPNENDCMNENYDMFWGSDRTIVFADLYELHDFILDYRGAKYDKIINEYDYVRECLEKKEVLRRYKCMCGVDENLDIELMDELDNLIMEKGVSPETVFATLKTMLISQYSIQFDEVVPRLAG